MFGRKSVHMPEPHLALPGHEKPIDSPGRHFVNGNAILPPYPEGYEQVMFGMGCFWGAERKFWQIRGVYVTAVGYAGGYTQNPSYEEVCTGLTGHSEVVCVVFDPFNLNFVELLKIFWESHDPTQGMRQGNDVGTQYRSVIYVSSERMLKEALASRDAYQAAICQQGKNDTITTEIMQDDTIFFAETYHQQYLAKNPDGYCGLKGLGVKFSNSSSPLV